MEKDGMDKGLYLVSEEALVMALKLMKFGQST
jgi:hypothetical protein